MNKKMDIVQLLRAFGCVFIMMFHTPESYILKPQLSGFVLAVFFTISGFFLIKGITKTKKYYFRKKMIRILPLYYLLTLLIFTLDIVKPGLTRDTPATPINLIKSLLFFPYFSNGNNYFPVLSVGWTLIIEVFVYISFYCCYLLAECIGKHIGNTALISICFFVLFINAGWLIRYFFNINYPLVEVWCSKYQFSFIFGMIIFILTDKKEWSPIKKWNLLKSSIVSCLILAMFIVFSYCISAVPVIVAGCTTCLCLLFFKEMPVIKPLVFLGNISFSFYLIHKFVIAVVLKLVPKLPVSGLYLELLVIMASFAITASISFISYILIEKKLSAFLFKNLCLTSHTQLEKNPRD